jgi:hypothetical protein
MFDHIIGRDVVRKLIQVCHDFKDLLEN